MLQNIVAVAIRTIRHNDRSSILTAWSPTLGRISLIMRDGKGTESRRRRALTMPFSIFEVVVDIRQRNELLMAHEIKIGTSHNKQIDITSHPVRTSLAFFCAEVLNVLTREGEMDPAIWNIIIDTSIIISTEKGTGLSNLPMLYLLRFASIMGIEPEISQWQPGLGLDLIEGVFRSTKAFHNHWLSPNETKLAVTLAKCAHTYSHFNLIRLPRNVRNDILDMIISYFSLHHYPLDRLKSLGILKTVFSA